MLWRTRGGYDITIRFEPELDLNEFGGHFGTGKYNAEYKFSISHEGIWQADFKIDYIQTYDTENDTREEYRFGPFYAQEYSHMKGNAALRAKKLARPIWGIDGRTHDQFEELLNEEFFLNQTTEWSFNWKWKGSGSW
jgi:hypothetical protein